MSSAKGANDMSYRTITADEAKAIVADDSADNLPFQILTVAGKNKVAEWAHAHSKRGILNMEPIYAEAEQSANDAAPGETITLELRAIDSATGRPESLRLEATDFEWQVAA
jgi:hypothetical protein